MAPGPIRCRRDRAPRDYERPRVGDLVDHSLPTFSSASEVVPALNHTEAVPVTAVDAPLDGRVLPTSPLRASGRLSQLDGSQQLQRPPLERVLSGEREQREVCPGLKLSARGGFGRLSVARHRSS